MARYVAIIGFNSAANAARFSYNNPTLSPSNVDVTQGFNAPSISNLGTPSGQAVTPNTWVMVTSDSLNQLISVTSGQRTSVTYDTTNNKFIDNTNNIDPNSLTVTQGQQSIFQNGILQTPTTAPPPTPAIPQSLQDQFTQFQLQQQNLLDQLNKYFFPEQPPIVPIPAIPQSLQDQITQFLLQRQQFLDQLNQYFNPSPDKPPVPAMPPSFQAQVDQFNLQTQNFLDQLNQYLNQQPQDQPIPFQPIYDNPDLRQLLKFVVPPDSQNVPPDVPLTAPELPPPIEIPKVPYPPGFYPEGQIPQFDPTQPAQPIEPNPNAIPGFFPDYLDPNVMPVPDPRIDPYMERPSPLPDPYQIGPLNPYRKPAIPISDSGIAGGLHTNNPIFTLVLEASFAGTTWLSPSQIWWSTDAVSWTLAPSPADGLPQLQTNTLNYFNGLWVFNLSFLIDPSAGGTFASVVVYSYNGKSWKLGWGSANFTTGNITVTAVVPSSQFAAGSANTGLITASFINFVIPCEMPANPKTNNNGFGDSIYTGSVLVDPGQNAGISATYASNPLPPGITAVRLRAVSLEVTAFDYTTTKITPTIVAGGYVGATWITSFSQPGQTGVLNSNLIYGLPTPGLIV